MLRTPPAPQAAPRPKLVFFQWNHAANARSAAFLVNHMSDHVACLSTHFDVVVVAEDCDFRRVCDLHEPDLALFESGYRTHGSRRIEISGAAGDASIPKLGLHNGDAWCDRRAGFISDMDLWGVETFFSICTTTPAYTPALADRLFVWPNFINPSVFRDHGLPKTIPVMIAGQSYGLYPWRQAIYPLLAGAYPSLVCPQFRYESAAASRMLSGESYARALNASHVSPSCGTMAGEVVRKHFEIPGAMALLVAQRSPALEAAGFADMENCLFVEPGDALERLDALFRQPELMRRITEAGHRLVHERHTLRHRPQLHQWFMLNRALGPGERIVQPDPFGDLTVAPASGPVPAPHVVIPGGPDRLLLRAGDALLAAGDIAGARRKFDACLSYVGYLPEARLRLALCDLQEGKAAEARERLAALIETTTVHYGAADPDPVEWALFLVALLAEGRLAQATALCDRYKRLAHPELDRLRDALRRLAGAEAVSPADPSPRIRRSVHAMPARSEAEWSAWLADLLGACGRADFVAALREPAADGRGVTGAPLAMQDRLCGLLDAVLGRSRARALRPAAPPLAQFRYPLLVARRLAEAVLPREALKAAGAARRWLAARVAGVRGGSA